VTILDIDIETYSGVELKKSNVYAYVEDPEFEVLMAAWSLEDGPVEVALGEKEILEIPGLWDDDVLKCAHNAGFERVCLSRMNGMSVGDYLPPEHWLDTMALAAEYGWPRGLGKLAIALGAEPKDEAGTRLINLFCMPYRGRRVRPDEYPEKWADFVEYCRQDVVTLQDIRHRLPDWPEKTIEHRLWNADQRINDRGIKVDLPFVHKAVEAATENSERARTEAIEITGIENPGSTQQLTQWFYDNDLVLGDLKADTVTSALNGDCTPEVKRVLELRQELALVASRKYEAALRGCSIDGRLRGQFSFHAAHTGRWSSRGVQLHNLPRQSDPREAAGILDLTYGLGASPDMLKSLVRPMFLGPFAISDFSAIEARVIAWLAGEQWVLDAFEEGRDIYVETAARMGGMTRQEGKVAVLALGYQGSVGSLRAMGYGTGEETISTTTKRPFRSGQVQAAREESTNQNKTESEALALVKKWRKANPRIVRFWTNLESVFRSGGTLGRLTVEAEGSDRIIRLPSGRGLHYHKVSTGSRLRYLHIQGYREDTYGGRLAENVTQAVARDLLADAMLRLDEAGYYVVGHVHDEVIVESDDLEGIRRIMKTGPDWSEGLPLDASADLAERYTK
jgi:DNA polymerase